MIFYLPSLHSEYIDFVYFILSCEILKIKLLPARGNLFFYLSKYCNFLLYKIFSSSLQELFFTTKNELNLNTKFKVVWASFIGIEELIYIITKKATTFFKHCYSIKSDIIFFKQDQYGTLRLKNNKININHTKVFIIFAKT